MKSQFQTDVCGVLHDIGRMLIAKNAAYGNSALDPVRVFSRADPVEQLKVRIDDKLSRLKRGAAAGEDVITDLIGYLVLLKVAEMRVARVPNFMTVKEQIPSHLLFSDAEQSRMTEAVIHARDAVAPKGAQA